MNSAQEEIENLEIFFNILQDQDGVTRQRRLICLSTLTESVALRARIEGALAHA